MKNAPRFVPGRGPGQVKFILAPGPDRLCREKLDQASSAEAPWRRRKKRPKTADSPKGADPAGAGQVVARGKARPERSRGMKWLVDVVDETGETVALATILRSRKLDQN